MLVLLLGACPATAAERMCGWLENPTPANWFLRDRRALWIIAEQGQYMADGFDAMPDLTRRGWVETNGSYGHGCACLTATVDRATRRVTRLLAAQPLPLARCRADRALPRP